LPSIESADDGQTTVHAVSVKIFSILATDRIVRRAVAIPFFSTAAVVTPRDQRYAGHGPQQLQRHVLSDGRRDVAEEGHRCGSRWVVYDAAWNSRTQTVHTAGGERISGCV
jgi:hypothetical protein